MLWYRPEPWRPTALPLAAKVLYAVVHTQLRPEVPPTMPAEYRALLEASWAEDPQQRWAVCHTACRSLLTSVPVWNLHVSAELKQ